MTRVRVSEVGRDLGEDLEGGRSLPVHDPVGERLGSPTDRIEREDEDHGAGDGPDARERRQGKRPEIQEGDEGGDDREDHRSLDDDVEVVQVVLEDRDGTCGRDPDPETDEEEQEREVVHWS